MSAPTLSPPSSATYPLAPSAATGEGASTSPTRLVSLDAYRGLIMLAMASSGLGLAATPLAGQPGWSELIWQLEHVPWIGCSFWDLIQPAFMFMVGVAMPFSVASRRAKGHAELGLWLHALVRSVVLVLLGVMLATRSTDTQTTWTFTNVLAQIGLGYMFAFALVGRPRWMQLAFLVVILAGTWAAFRFYPLPPEGFDYASVGVEAGQLLPAPWAQFSPQINVSAAVDRWLLNQFPRAERFVSNVGGYQTLNFVPSIATMLLGVMIGELLRGPHGTLRKLLTLIAAGGVCLALGLAAGGTICPVVKRIWTPSWVLYSGAWVIWMLAVFYLVIDVLRLRAWSFPLVVVGMNSLAMYLMSQLLRPWTTRMLETHFLPSTAFDPPYGPIVKAGLLLAVFWLACLWMYRQKIFVRV